MSKELFDTHIIPVQNKMYRYALSILKTPDNAHDVVQECLLKIWKKRHMIATIDNPESWVMRITRNQCYDWVKVNRFHLADMHPMDQADTFNTDENLLMSDRQSWLKRIIGELPAKHREVFHLREVEELSYQEIADILSLTLAEVKISLFRTREKIKVTITKIDAYGLAN
ncbi:MAG: RNA polymerase sigma factor [Bacteroidales bacterium]|jgi:RNA polymerase sigma-70 factor (ECF subfamily)